MNQSKRPTFAFRRPIRRAFRSSLGKSFVLLPSAFLSSLAVGLVSFGMIFFLRDVYHAPAGLIGWFSALWTLSYFAGCIFLRPILRDLLPRYSMILATSLMGLLSLGIILIRSLLLTFILYGLFGVSLSLFFPRLMGWLFQRMSDKTLNRVMARFNISWSAATIISPVLGGLLFERSAILPLVTSMSIFFALTLFIGAASIFLPRIRRDNRAEDQAVSEDDGTDRSTPLRYPAWIGLVTIYVLMGILGSAFPLFLRGKLLLSESHVGVLLLARSLAATVFFIVLGRTEFWHFKKRYILFAQAGAALIIMSMIFVRSSFAFSLLLSLMGLIMSYSYVSSVFHGGAGTHKRAKRMAIHEAVITAGAFAGASVGGTLYQSFSMNAVFLFALALVTCGALLQIFFMVRIKNRAAVIE
jgi:DHA1 family multidrug resistance protein-like MFS transporter/DHA1 family quinolone resistance protein-like MFS transporter